MPNYSTGQAIQINDIVLLQNDNHMEQILNKFYYYEVERFIDIEDERRLVVKMLRVDEAPYRVQRISNVKFVCRGKDVSEDKRKQLQEPLQEFTEPLHF